MKIIENKKILSTPRFDVYCDKVSENSKTNEYYYLSKPDAVLIIPYNARTKQILFIESNRYVIGDKNLEIPGGRIENGELTETSAKRELREECALHCNQLELGTAIYPLPSITNEKVYIFFSEQLNLKDAHLTDESTEENIKSIRILTYEQAANIAFNGSMKCAVDAFAVLLFLSKIKAEEVNHD